MEYAKIVYRFRIFIGVHRSFPYCFGSVVTLKYYRFEKYKI